MSKDKETFLKELLNDFKIEAAEHLQAISNGLLELEKDLNSPVKQSIVETVFREIHSMKGAARAVNLMHIERLCISLESIFSDIKKESITLSMEMFDVFFQVTDLLSRIVNELDLRHKTISENNITELIEKLKFFTEAERITPQQRIIKRPGSPAPGIQETETGSFQKSDESKSEKNIEKGTIRVATEKLYDMLRMSEEMITIKSELQYHAGHLQQISGQLRHLQKKIEDCMNEHAGGFKNGQNEKIIKEKELLRKHQNDLFHLGNNIEQLQRKSDRSIDDLILSVRRTLLQSFSSLFMIVPRIVRDLSKEYDKKISVDMQGSETEIDRRILEQMKDPLIHLIRNCIDHGIETRDVRRKNNKDEAGNITINVSGDSGQKIKIVIQDDGAGIDKEKLIRSAIKAGAIVPEEVKSMSENQINMLIFVSGISTSPFITDVSGRGLGMAIVAEKIEGLGGSIDVESHLGERTTFTITLPQTLTTFRGLLVKASESLFLIPTLAVLKAIRVLPGEISTVESKNTIKLDNESISLVSLANALGLRKRHSGKKIMGFHGLVFQHAQKKLVFIVDEVLGEHEGVVKPLGPQLKHVNNFAGASLLGDGRIVPVLNIYELLALATGKSYIDNMVLEGTADKTIDGKRKQILVVEDSITVRNMLRNYLDSAGYLVKTAVNGQEAYEQLMNEPFDIVVSDIEMPQMNGFELTEKIRQDISLGQIPVILVSALESPDDRKRGMDAGANAYIVKSSFEKSNLIDIIRRLI